MKSHGSKEFWTMTYRTLTIFIAALFLITLSFIPPEKPFNPTPQYESPVFYYELVEDDPNLIQITENFFIWRVNESSNMSIIIPFQIIRTGNNYNPIVTRTEIITPGDYTISNSSYTALDMSQAQFEGGIMTFGPGTFNISVRLILDNRTIEYMGLYHSTIIIIEVYTNTGGGTRCGMPPPIFEERFDIVIEKNQVIK
jgi:hypothetical protein